MAKIKTTLFPAVLRDRTLLMTEIGQERPKQINMINSKMEVIPHLLSFQNFNTIILLTKANVKYIIIMIFIDFSYHFHPSRQIMELLKLRYFHVVAQQQHVTRAADMLHIAQPALTQAIKSLEHELAVPLFKKRGRNICLTEYGIMLKEKLDRLLPEFDGIVGDMQRLKGQLRKTVRLNILAATTFVINAIVDYRKLHPDIIIDLEQNAWTEGSDITIYTNGVTRTGENCKSRCVKEEKIYLAVPQDSRYASLPCVSLSEMQSERFVMLSGSRLFRAICDKLCAYAGFVPQILFESDSPNAVQNIISTGTGIAFWPEYSWGKLNNHNVKLLPMIDPHCQRELIFELHQSAEASEYAEDFYDFLLKRTETTL